MESIFEVNIIIGVGFVERTVFASRGATGRHTPTSWADIFSDVFGNAIIFAIAVTSSRSGTEVVIYTNLACSITITYQAVLSPLATTWIIRAIG